MTCLDENWSEARASETSMLFIAALLSPLAPFDAFAASFTHDHKESSL